ncbi:MAG: alpha-2-macroglobulin family protein [Melioribacteraceae bacterium]|nr:alpha-2-macroglobulin family protein [Melioribacteraceae bacterium]
MNKRKGEILPGNRVNIKADAEFLFGADAAGLRYEADIQLRHQPFSSNTFKDYDFSRSTAQNTAIENTFLEGMLDEYGEAELSYILPGDIAAGGIVKGYAFVSVFDLTGRPVNRVADFTVYPKDYFIGVKAPGYYFGTNERLNFKAAVVNENDAAINSFTGTAQLVRYEWQTVLKKDYGDRYYYTSEEKEIVEWEKDIKFNNGLTDIPVVLDKSGKYQLRIAKKGNENEGYVYKDFYAYGWGSSTASSFEVDKEGRIEIVFDKEKYEPNENAKILFMTPFAGRMLITFERNGVYDHRYVDVTDRSYELNIETKELFMPNAYVTATLFRPHEADNQAPFLVAHGFASMKVEKSANNLPLTITSNEKVKPSTKQKVKIKTSSNKNIYITLAAVDEGILQIKNYQTPDPYNHFNAKRPLRVSSYDLYKLLLPEIVSISSSTGGDKLAAELQKRANPITTKRFKLFSYWSGIRKTNSNGEVEIELDIPQFNGEVRLMALAYDGQKFGSSDKAMKVADDLIIEPEIPRFLSVGDSLVMPVTIINTTSERGDVNVNVSAEGPINLISESSQKVEVEGNSTAKAQFVIIAEDRVGNAKIKISTSGMAQVTNEIEIGVRPISPFVVESGSGLIKAGEEKLIQIPSNYFAGTQSTVLTISKFPAVKFAKQLKYLVGYPHGCLEQTVSKLFPQIYFDELAKIVAPEIYRSNNPVYFVKEGIRKIESMQLFDGAFAYWQGAANSNWWSTVYAVHFLLEAKNAGYQVNETVLKNAVNYLQNKVKEKSTTDYVTYEGSRRTVSKIAPKESIYSLYVLALAGKADLSTMNYYKARPHLLSRDSKYLLAGAYALNGKWTSYKDMLPEIFTPEKTERQTGDTFDSEARSNAIMLNVMLEVDPNNERVQSMVKHLSSLTEQLYSTQERAWVFLTLGKAASLNADADVKVDVSVDEAKLTSFDGVDLSLSDSILNGAEIILNASGEGEVYYFWSTEGVKVNEPVKEEDSFMSVRRNYYDYRTGSSINNFEQGQMILAKITLTGYDRSAENIVITDMIPAGFEIENPRLTEVNRLNVNSNYLMNIQYSDIRDDRIILFTDLQRNKSNEFYYLLRVVNKGKFVLPAIGAEAMYDKEYRSYNGGKEIIVR